MSLYDGKVLSSVISLLLVQLIIILCLSRILNYLMRPIKQPMVVAEIACGIILGPSVLVSCLSDSCLCNALCNLLFVAFWEVAVKTRTTANKHTPACTPHDWPTLSNYDYGLLLLFTYLIIFCKTNNTQGYAGDFSNTIFPKDSLPKLNEIAQLGLVLYLFMVGINLDPTEIRKVNILCCYRLCCCVFVVVVVVVVVVVAAAVLVVLVVVVSLLCHCCCCCWHISFFSTRILKQVRLLRCLELLRPLLLQFL